MNSRLITRIINILLNYREKLINYCFLFATLSSSFLLFTPLSSSLLLFISSIDLIIDWIHYFGTLTSCSHCHLLHWFFLCFLFELIKRQSEELLCVLAFLNIDEIIFYLHCLIQEKFLCHMIFLNVFLTDHHWKGELKYMHGFLNFFCLRFRISK